MVSVESVLCTRTVRQMGRRRGAAAHHLEVLICGFANIQFV